MAVTIELSDNIFARLQKHAVPLVDTPVSVIERALDALEAGKGERVIVGAIQGPHRFNPGSPPDLAFTTPLHAEVAGRVLSKANTYWNNVLHAVIDAAVKKGVTSDQLLNLLTIPAIKGVKEDTGYKYISAAGVSIQGQDANNAWKQTYKIASAAEVSVEVKFVWQDASKAAMPNAVGLLAV